MLYALLMAAALTAQPAADPDDAPAPTTAATDRAGNRLEPLVPLAQSVIPGTEPAADDTGLFCDGPERSWCVSGSRDGETGAWRLTMARWHRLLDFRPAYFAVPEPVDGSRYAIWPHLVRERDGSVMFGLLTTRGTSYAGGGASVTRLTLVRVEARTGVVEPVLEVPVAGSATIRACFSEEDMRARRDVCHDEYALAGSLRLDPGDPGLPEGTRPRFVFETRARTFPGRVSRDADSRDRGPLGRGDLVWWRDADCSYRRSFALDPATGRYAPDAPLPACADYLDIGE